MQSGQFLAEDEEKETKSALAVESEIEAGARLMLDKYFPEWEIKLLHRNITTKNATPVELLTLCSATFYTSTGQVEDETNSRIYAELFFNVRTNNFDSFIEVFDKKYLPTMQFGLSRGNGLRHLLTSFINDICGRSLLRNATLLGHQEFLNKAYLQVIRELEIEKLPLRTISHTRLSLATMFNQVDVMKNLIDSGVSVNEKTADKETVLSIAIVFDCRDALQVLLAHKLDKHDYWSALFLGIIYCRVQCVEYMLQKGIMNEDPYKIKGLLEKALSYRCPLIPDLLFNFIDDIEDPKFYSGLIAASLVAENVALAMRVYERIIDYKGKSPPISPNCKLFYQESIGGDYYKMCLALEEDGVAYVHSEGQLIFLNNRKDNNRYLEEELRKGADHTHFDLITKTKSLEFDSSRMLTSNELNRVTLEIAHSYSGDLLLDVEHWNEAFVIFMLKLDIIVMRDANFADENFTIVELLTSGADPTDVIQTFILPDEVRALFKAKYEFDDAISAMLNGDSPDVYLTNCFSLAPEFIYSIFKKILSGETKLTCVDDDKIDDLVDTLSRSLFAIAKSLTDPASFQIINGIIGMHLYSSSLHGFENREEKLLQALLHLRNAGKDDDHVNRTRVQVYNSLFNGSHSGLVSSLSMLSSNAQSSQCFRPSRYARLFPGQTTDDPTRRSQPDQLHNGILLFDAPQLRRRDDMQRNTKIKNAKIKK